MFHDRLDSPKSRRFSNVMLPDLLRPFPVPLGDRSEEDPCNEHVPATLIGPRLPCLPQISRSSPSVFSSADLVALDSKDSLLHLPVVSRPPLRQKHTRSPAHSLHSLSLFLDSLIQFFNSSILSNTLQIPAFRSRGCVACERALFVWIDRRAHGFGGNKEKRVRPSRKPTFS